MKCVSSLLVRSRFIDVKVLVLEGSFDVLKLRILFAVHPFTFVNVVQKFILLGKVPEP